MSSVDAEELAKGFHELYEALAPNFRYETREESAKPWEEVPEQNKKLMIEVCRKIKNRYHMVPLFGGNAGKLHRMRILYRNHRGETSVRTVLPAALEFKSTPWHPEEQWVLEAFDFDKKEWRSFAARDIRAIDPTPTWPQLGAVEEILDSLTGSAEGWRRGTAGWNSNDFANELLAIVDSFRGSQGGNKAHLTLFKNWGGYGGLGGKYYDERTLDLTEEEKVSLYHVWDRVNLMMEAGELGDFHVLITCPGHAHDHPRLILNPRQAEGEKSPPED